MELSQRERDILDRLERDLRDDRRLVTLFWTRYLGGGFQPSVLAGFGAIASGMVIMFTALTMSVLVAFVGYAVTLVGFLWVLRSEPVRRTLATWVSRLAVSSRRVS